MVKNLKIIPHKLLQDYKDRIDFSPLVRLTKKAAMPIAFDYFKFYHATSSVYSSKIEGEAIDADSFLKHKFLKVRYEPDYTKRSDDLYKAYQFIIKNKLTAKNVLKAHKLLSKNLLAKKDRGIIRNNPMFVLNEEDRIEYVACEPHKVATEWEKFFKDVKKLKKANLSTKESFFYAAMIHLVFLKIHPLQDGNGRTARLIEKWFLQEKLGKMATAIELEKNYFKNKPAYYRNIRRIGLDYELLDYGKSLDFLLMTVFSL